MVQFCPKCGTQAPDDESLFCNKCGARLPPVIPVKQHILCPQCGATMTDGHAAFCDRCGSPLQRAPPAHVQPAVMRSAPVPPAISRKRCLSCGTPVTRRESDYCDACLALMSTPEPSVPAPQKIPEPEFVPAPQKIPVPEPVPAPQRSMVPDHIPAAVPAPAPDVPREPDEPPAGMRNRKTMIAAGAIALVAIIALAVIAGVMTGVIPGFGKDNSTIPVTPGEEPATATTTPARKTTTQPAPKPTLTPKKTTGTTAPTAVPSANVSATATANASVNSTANVSAGVTAGVSPTATRPLSNIDASRPFAIGDAATDGKGTLTVNGYSIRDKLKDPTPSNAIGKKYLILNITYGNLQQNQTADVDLTRMKVEDLGGYSFDQVTDDPVLENPFYLNGKTVPPQESRTGNMAFIVPMDATFLKFTYDFGNGKVAVFQFPQYL